MLPQSISFLFHYNYIFFFFINITSIFECFGLLNIQFPHIIILDAANPILYFKILHVSPYINFPSILWSPLWLY